MSLLRLAKKNRDADPKAFENARRELIESTIKNGQCPTNGAELAVIRKQIRNILIELEKIGVHAEIPAFQEYDQFVSNTKRDIDSFLGEEDNA
jgi:hypothetical protein